MCSVNVFRVDDGKIIYHPLDSTHWFFSPVHSQKVWCCSWGLGKTTKFIALVSFYRVHFTISCHSFDFVVQVAYLVRKNTIISARHYILYNSKPFSNDGLEFYWLEIQTMSPIVVILLLEYQSWNKLKLNIEFPLTVELDIPGSQESLQFDFRCGFSTDVSIF